MAVDKVAPEKILSGFLQIEPAAHHSTIAPQTLTTIP
jgi:hypothetical protein